MHTFFYEKGKVQYLCTEFSTIFCYNTWYFYNRKKKQKNVNANSLYIHNRTSFKLDGALIITYHTLLNCFISVPLTWNAWMSVVKTIMSARVILSVTRNVRVSRWVSNTFKAAKRSCFARSTFYKDISYKYLSIRSNSRHRDEMYNTNLFVELHDA